MTMKSHAIPSNRPPFRLSKTKQEPLDLFVTEKLKKGWIQVSYSPWGSNVFKIPKKDPQTDEKLSKAGWVHSSNATLPVRWVIDYCHVNSQTEVLKLPIPRVEELFDLMMGCYIYSVLDLADGYHLIEVEVSSFPFTAFRTHTETYQWVVAPMELAGMSGVWSHLVRVLFGKYVFYRGIFGWHLCLFRE